MGDRTIKIDRIDSAGELENTISRDNIVILDETQNTHRKISIYEEFTIGVEYCSHGIDIGYMLTNDESLLFMGVGPVSRFSTN